MDFEIRRNELISELTQVEEEMRLARLAMAEHKKKMWEAESNLVSAKEKYSKLSENLRILNSQDPQRPLTIREQDIARFEQVLPEIMEKIK